MSVILNENFTIVKSFNNNIILVKNKEQEKIIFKKGIGFGKKTGDIIEAGCEVEKIFNIEDEENKRNFSKIISSVDNKLIVLLEEMIAKMTDELGEQLHENIHISLIEHISYSMKRLKDGQEIRNPFLVEIETLYAKEFVMAKEITSKVSKEFNLEIPEGEIGFIALHIHSARSNGKLANSIKYSFLSNSIVEYVEDELNIEIDRKSLEYARFITHIRFAIERILTKTPIKNDLMDIIKEKYKDSYKIAKGAKDIISKGLGNLITSDEEVAYLTVYIERFRNSVNR